MTPVRLRSLAFCMLLLFTPSAFTAGGYWKPATPSGSGGGGGTCYLVVFNAPTYGNKQLIGNGYFPTPTTFTGFMKYTSNPQFTNSGSGGTRMMECGASGDCAWNYAVAYNYNSYTVASVDSLPIVSSTAIACW